MSEFLPYGRQTVDEADVQVVTEALRDPFLTQGPRVDSFERAFADRVGARHAVAFSSGTGALHAAAYAAGLGPGDELLTTPLGFVASANCALFLGARPLFSDIDPHTTNLDLARAVEAELHTRARACVAVSMTGLAVDLEPLQAGRAEGLVVVEDACHALGALRAGRPVGGDGQADMTTFSFHPVKAITTGEGGMVSTDDDAFAEALRTFRTHGIRRGKPRAELMYGGWHYDIESLGFNYRITDFQCALGEHQLGHLEQFIAARNQIAEAYRELLDGVEGVQMPAPAPADGRHAYHLFVVRFTEGRARRRAVYDHMHARGIGAQLHYIPIPAFALYQSLGYSMDGLDAAQAYYEQALSLPIFPAMRSEDVERVVRELREALASPLGSAPPAAAASEPAASVREPAASDARPKRPWPPAAGRRPLFRSRELMSRGRKVIPGATQTLSKGPTQWLQGLAPAYVERARGAHVWDVDGNRYLDFPMALGPVLLGHRYPAVDHAIARQLQSGITFTLPHRIEVEVAERVLQLVPGAERIRFAKSGSDATSAAVRLARARTGRERVIATGYHGWHDWYIGSTSRHLGVPGAVGSLIQAVAFGDLEALSAALDGWRDEVACVVCEPVGALEPSASTLREMADLAHRHGALIVFDEVITGFRLAPGGAQEYFGVQADLVCFGKALGNGMPISALAGPAGLMDALTDVFFSGTHGGETLSLAAAAATLDVVRTEPVCEHLWRLGHQLQDGVRGAIQRLDLSDWVSCSGAAPWTIVSVREPKPNGATLPAKSLLQQEMLKRGVLFNGSNFISYAHTEADIAGAIDAYDAALEVLAAALPDGVEDALEGPPVTPAFRTPS